MMSQNFDVLARGATLSFSRGSALSMESEVVDESIQSASVTSQPQIFSSSGSKRPLSVKQEKQDLRNARTSEQTTRAQASLELAKATCTRA